MAEQGRWFGSVCQDVRFAVRLLGRNPAFSAIAVVTLALGIGANTAMYSLLDAVVLHPLAYPAPERLCLVSTVAGASQRAHNSSYPNFRDCQQQARSFERMAAFRWKGFNLTGDGEAERVQAVAGSPGLIETLGVRPSLGRTIRANDDPHVAVISYGLWLRRYASDTAILGKALRLDGAAFTVVGVLPRSFHFQPRRGSEPDLFIPLPPDPQRNRFQLTIVARLRPGVRWEQAQAEMNTIAARIAAQNPEVDPRQGIRVGSLHGYAVQGTRDTALVLLGAVAFLLLIACANVANLLISRAVGREREIAIRLAVGASRGRLVRQMLTESVILALLSGVLGLALAHLALPLLAAIAPAGTSFLAQIQDNGIHLNGAVLAFTALVSVVAAILFGSLPALRSTRPVVSSMQIGWASAPPGRSRAVGALIAVEVALSFVLLAGAGLMLGTLSRLLAVDPGFRTGNLLTMSVMLPEMKYPDVQAQARYFTEALARLKGLPGVRAAAAVSMLPLTRSNWRMPFETDGPQPRAGEASFHSVSPGYFDTMGVPLVRGRKFTDADGKGAPLVAIVSRRMERRYWPDGGAVGRGLRNPETGERFAIVGVVGDVRQLGLDDDPRAEWFVPYAQSGAGNMMNEMSFVVRSLAAPGGSLVSRAKDALRGVDPEQPVTDVATMEQLISTDTASPRFVFALIGLFAFVAVALAAIGIYGVVSHAVARRTGEVAVRLALGAGPLQVVGLIARQHMVCVMGGVVAGVVGASALMRLLASQLYDVKPTDVATYTAAAILLVLVAAIADVVPAWRATRVMPAAVLRNE